MSSHVITTRMGRAGWDDHIHYGHHVYADLLGEESLASLLALGISGRRVGAAERAMLEDISCAMTLPDPRIWHFKATRAAATYGSTLAAFCVGVLCFESRFVGPWTTGQAGREMRALRDELAPVLGDEAAFRVGVLAWHGRQKRIMGYGVPFRPYDERVQALRTAIQRRGRDTLPYWSFAERVWTVLREEKGLEANIGSACAIAFLDLGFEPDEMGALCVSLNLNGAMANAVEGANDRPASLQRLPPDHVRYVGPAPRQSPRAQAAVRTS